jgi:N-methylhydantoinase A
MLVTQPRIDVVRTRVYRTSALTTAEVEANFAELEAEIHRRFAQEGDEAGRVRFQRQADLRYHGQEHTVSVPVGGGEPVVAQIETDFHAAHERLYTFRLPDTPVEFVNFHVAGFRQVTVPKITRLGTSGRSASRPAGAQRLVDFDVDGVHPTLIYEREQLPAGFSAAGPLIVEEAAATTLVHPGQSLEIDIYGNLVIHLKSG